MLKGRNLGAAHVILLAVAINALAVTFWLALTSIIPIRITPGFGLSHDVAAGTDWIEVWGYLILWLAFFAIVGVLAAVRILLHDVSARSPGVSRSARGETAYDPRLATLREPCDRRDLRQADSAELEIPTCNLVEQRSDAYRVIGGAPRTR